MNTKIKYCTDRGGEYIEFPMTSTRLIMPNGNEYVIRFDPLIGGLVINKAYSDDQTAMNIMPRVSNEIVIK